MFYVEEKLIWDKNSAGEEYLINIETGAKCTWISPCGGICPDLITRGDMTRALADGIDISNLREATFTREEYASFVNWAYSWRWRRKHQ